MKSQLLSIFLVLAQLVLLSICLPADYSIIENNDVHDLVSTESLVQIFQKWKMQHKKAYEPHEESKRLWIFGQNLKYVLGHHKRSKLSGSGHHVGLNKFADLTNEEFQHKYLSNITAKNKKLIDRPRTRSDVLTCEAPAALDWRRHGVVTGVKDQGQCGSCWAFSSIGAIESVNAINTGDLISLSEQELVDCDSNDEGCNGGEMDSAFEWVINNEGVDSESDYPYISSDGNDGRCNTKKEETRVVSIDGFYDVEESDSALLCAVVQQPVSVGIDASAIDFQLYSGGIYDGKCSSNPNDIDHAVLIVGYGSAGNASKDYWIVKNSWGTSWGMDGYFYLKRNSDLKYGTCGVNAMASYPTQSNASPAPQSPLSPEPTPSPGPSPSPSPPAPTVCGDFSYCPSDETCCCLLQMFNFCFVYGCCPYENAVCCAESEYCCPAEYPVCEVSEGLCLEKSGDQMGIMATKRYMAKHKLPWAKFDEKGEINKQLIWRGGKFLVGDL